MKKVVGIIQARIGSTRLPYKMLLSLKGHPIIEWVLTRTSKSKKLDQIIVAIPDTQENDILETIIRDLGFSTFRGSEQNVLDRFYQCAKYTKASHIVRICADNPLICPKEIDNLIDFYFRNPCDYAYNHIPKNNQYPDGLGAEIVGFDILERISVEAKSQNEHEHCLSYITNNPTFFTIKTFDPPNPKIAFPTLKFDIDTFSDYCLLHSLPITLNTTAQEIIDSIR